MLIESWDSTEEFKICFGVVKSLVNEISCILILPISMIPIRVYIYEVKRFIFLKSIDTGKSFFSCNILYFTMLLSSAHDLPFLNSPLTLTELLI